MDRSLEASQADFRFSWLKAVTVMLAVVAIIVIGTWLVRAYPNSGYRAGYEDVISEGQEWIRAEVDAAGGSALPLCSELHNRAEQSALEPRYDLDTFMKGCGDAVDHLYGRHVPMSADRG